MESVACRGAAVCGHGETVGGLGLRERTADSGDSRLWIAALTACSQAPGTGAVVDSTAGSTQLWARGRSRIERLS